MIVYFTGTGNSRHCAQLLARRLEDQLVDAFQHFEAIDPALVPKDSLLREFIGGGSYQYH